MTGTGSTVSANPGDWDERQQQQASWYGTCRSCGAPRDAVMTELEPGVFQSEFECLNGHRGPGV